MSRVLCVALLLCAVSCHALALQSSAKGATEAEGETELDMPTTRPRRGKPLTAATVFPGKSFGNQEVIIVPKGDPRAQSPAGPTPPAPEPAEPRLIVDADVIDSSPEPTGEAAVTPPRPPLILQSGTNPGACLSRWNGASAAAKAAEYQANYKRRGVKYSQPNRQFGITAKYSDCSSFVTSILNDLGMNCLFAKGRYTAYMNQQIKKRGGYKQTAKLGDIVMWGGHTGMIVKVCSATTYSMVAMGNSGAGRAECKTVAGLKSWGSGGWLGFWTPRP